MRVLVELSLPLVKLEGHLLAAKGPNPQVRAQLSHNTREEAFVRCLQERFLEVTNTSQKSPTSIQLGTLSEWRLVEVSLPLGKLRGCLVLIRSSQLSFCDFDKTAIQPPPPSPLEGDDNSSSQCAWAARG